MEEVTSEAKKGIDEGKEKLEGVVEPVKENAEEAVAAVEEVKKAVKKATKKAADKVEDAVAATEEKTEEVKKTVKKTAKKAVDKAEEETAEVEASAEEAADRAEEKEEDSVDEAKALGLNLKDQLKGTVKKLGLAGALVDIHKDYPAFVHISQIPRPEGKENCNNITELLQPGQEIDVWVKKVKDGRVELTMIQPLALEWREIKKDMVVKGTVQRLEKFGAFVEIGAERPGLIHISEMAHSYVRQPSDILKEGDEVEAQVLEVNRRKKQIKLSMKALQPEPEEEEVKTSTTAAARPTSARAQQLKEGKFSSAEPHEKRAAKRNTRKREELNKDVNFVFTDESSTEAEPTAMEIAIRAAMEKAKGRKQNDDKKKKNVSSEQEDILSRTLNNKVG